MAALRRAVALPGLAMLFALGSATSGFAQAIDPALWVTNGTVYAVARSGGTIYIGGQFTQVGPATGCALALEASTGAPQQPYPLVAGDVSASAPDGSGGWYIGGSFVAVQGQPRANLAHLDSGGSLTSWSPSASGTVLVLAVSGGTVYVGGGFTNIGGQTRNNIAALDGTTGAVSSWNPNANSSVRVLAVSGSTIYAGGDFTTIGGQTRNHIAALDASTGAASSWDPNANNIVRALEVGGSTIYAGGDFTGIGGQTRNRLAALDASTGAASSWDPNANNAVNALALNGSTLYAGGQFTTIGGQARNNIAALDVASGNASGWNPNLTGGGNIFALAFSGSTVYAGGIFIGLGGQARNNVAALDVVTGNASSWNPNLNNVVRTLVISAGRVCVGGSFTSIGGQTRNNLAALDATTGAATSWNPNPDGYVHGFALSGDTFYVGGSFIHIGGQTRFRIAALDATTGSATSWNPNADNPVDVVTASGGTVYAAGAFTNIGGQPRSFLAALDAVTGAASGWDPSPNSSVSAVAVSGSTVYAGGLFTSIGGQARNRIAALDAGTGAATPWNSNANGQVLALAVSGSTVYAGGAFTSIGGQTRNRIAALDNLNGNASSWNPNVSSGTFVRTLALSGSTVYAGGSFTVIGGQPRNYIAAVDAVTGVVSSWNPSANLGAQIISLAVSTGTVYAGGLFQYIGLLPQAYFAEIAAVPDIQSVSPAKGGDAGVVTATVVGHNLRTGATAKLSRSGQLDIFGTGVQVAADGLSLTTTFDLSGRLAGAWNVVITNPDQSATLPNGFTIEALAAPQLKVSVVGPTLQSGNQVVRRDRRTAFDLVIENPGNVDAQAVPLWLTGIPTDATLELDFTLSYPPQAGGEPDWSTVPVTFTASGGNYLTLVIPRVPPGTTTRRVYLAVPGPTHPPFQLVAAVTPPWVDGNKFRACLAGGGITNPACMGTQLDAINAYLAANPQLTAVSGIAVWAKNAWACEGAGSLGAAVTKAQQVLGYLEQPVEQGSGAVGCEDVALARWRETPMVSIVGSVDPNDKLGATGTLSGQQALPYSIRFENVSTATASAQDVIVTDQLDVNTMELGTVSLDQITFGSHHIYPPPGLTSYATTVDLRPTQNLLVNVAVNLDPFTHVLSWYFNSIDPATGRTPTNAQIGFLPPNLAPPQGEGSVLFTVLPKSGSTSVSNAASILFDDPPATTTPAWLNALDQVPPASHVLPLAGNSNLPSIPIAWTADGSPPDLRDFTIYVSEDGAPYRVWRLNTPTTSDTLAPPKDHHLHSYDFYSVARDQIGNIEAPPVVRDATTTSTTTVEGVGAPRLALAGARPNPASGGTLQVWFSLPTAEPATLELLDVAGHRLIRREVGSLGPGPHLVTLAPSPRARAGLYFLRLVQGTRALRARVTILM